MSDVTDSPDCTPPPRAELEWAWDFLQTLRGEIGRVLIGQRAVVDQVLIALSTAGHVLIEGAPGAFACTRTRKD